MNIEKLKETLDAATPGPWPAEYDTYGDEIWLGGSGCGTWVVGPCFLGGDGLEPGKKNVMDANAALIAMAPDIAAEVIRLTAERDAAVAANAAMMVRVEEARRLFDRGLWLTEDGPAARAWLTGKAGA